MIFRRDWKCPVECSISAAFFISAIYFTLSAVIVFPVPKGKRTGCSAGSWDRPQPIFKLHFVFLIAFFNSFFSY